jgi:hypothetical protein
MLEDFLNDLGRFMVSLVREEIKTPRPRFTKKSPRMMKRNSPYNFYATGRGWRSVEYEVVDDNEIYILMEDYMVNYVFGDGSKPSTPPRSRAAIASLEKWIKAKGITPRDRRGRFMKVKSMAFAIGKNLSKVGYAGYNYQTEDFNNDVVGHIELLLQTPEYQDLALDQTIQEIIDRINTLGQQTFNIALGRE